MTLKKINIALYGLGVLSMFAGTIMMVCHIHGRRNMYVATNSFLLLALILSLYQMWTTGSPDVKLINASSLLVIGCILFFAGTLLKMFHFNAGVPVMIAGSILAGLSYAIILFVQLAAKEKKS